MSNITLLDPALFNRPAYQRDLRASHVNRIVAEWNDAAVGAVTVSQRKDGTLWVMDGGHRSAAAVRVGVKLIPAIVKTGLSVGQEAELFLELNDAKNLSAIDKYKASVIANLMPQAAIDKIIRHYGWKVIQGNKDGHISAPLALEYVYGGAGEVPSAGGTELLVKTIYIVTQAWGLNSDGTNASMLKALGKVLGRYGNDIDAKVFINHLRATTPSLITGQGNGLSKSVNIPSTDAHATILVGVYNKKLKSSAISGWEIRK